MKSTVDIILSKRLFLLIFVLTQSLAIPGIYAQRIMTLEQALKLAKEQSPTIRQAETSLEQSRQNLIAEKAALKSQFSLNLTPFSYNQGRNYNEFLGEWITTETTSASGTFSVKQPVAVTDGTISLSNSFNWQDSHSSYGENEFTGFNNSLLLNIDQPVFTYNRTKVNMRELELSLENSQLNYALKLLSIEKSVTTAFYEVYQAQQNKSIAEEEYENLQESFAIIKNKVEAGLSAEEELIQAELDLLSSKSDVNDAEVSLENSKDSFKQLLGLPLSDDFTILAEVNIESVQVDLQKAIDKGLSSRMELRQHEISIEEGMFDLLSTRALNEFEGNINASVGLIGENTKLADVYSTPTKNKNVSLSLTVPILDWGERKARIKATQAAQKALVFDLEDERVNIELSIRQVYRSLSNLKNKIEIAKKTKENAILAYDINLEKYKNGDLTSMDLDEFQTQLTQKKQALTSAMIDYKLELLNLKIQTLYDFENDLSIVEDYSEYYLVQP
jgi:outer membrane protein